LSFILAVMDLLAPAKINLFLHVIGKRPDGYHELVTLMVPIGLYDRIRLTVGGDGIRLSSNDPGLPLDRHNLAWRAADAFFNLVQKPAGLCIDLEKHIPVGAGLGGGSSDAATVLLGLNAFFGHPFSRPQLMAAGRRLGADVPFFLHGGPALATGIGDVLAPCPDLAPRDVLLIFPAINVSTADVYRGLNLGLTKCRDPFKKDPLKDQRFDPARHLFNDLESVAVARYPQIDAAKSLLIEAGAIGALMSGSGSAVFGLFATTEDADRAVAAITGRIAQHWKLYRCSMLTDPAVQEAG